MEINERVAKVETRMDGLEDRIDKQEKLIESIHKIASKQDVLGEKMDKVETALEDIKMQPAKKWDKATWIMVSGTITFMLGYFLDKIIR